MNTSSKIRNVNSEDAFDRLIFEENLRIKELFIDKELDMMLVIFNSGKLLKLHLSDYPTLNKANKKQLSTWKLISNGVGVRWELLDEDLSVKGFIKSAAINEMLRHLQEKKDDNRTVA